MTDGRMDPDIAHSVSKKARRMKAGRRRQLWIPAPNQHSSGGLKRGPQVSGRLHSNWDFFIVKVMSVRSR